MDAPRGASGRGSVRRRKAACGRAGAHLGLGQVHESEGRLDDALSEYLKVALLYANEAAVSEALFAAGRVLETQNSREQAAARYRELVQEHGGSPFAAREPRT